MILAKTISPSSTSPSELCHNYNRHMQWTKPLTIALFDGDWLLATSNDNRPDVDHHHQLFVIFFVLKHQIELLFCLYDCSTLDKQKEREKKTVLSISKTTNDWKLFVHNLSRKEKRRKSFFFHVILSQSNFVNVTIIDFPEFFATMNAMQTLFIVILPIGHFGRLQSSIASFLKNYEEWAKDLSMKLTWLLFNWDDSIDCLQNWHGL